MSEKSVLKGSQVQRHLSCLSNPHLRMPAQATILTAKFGLPIEHAHTHKHTHTARGSKGFQTDVPSGRGSRPDRIINH